MAELTVFGFHPGYSLLHALDPRIKLIMVAMLSLSSMNASAWGMGILTLFIAAGIVHLRVKPFRLLGDLRFFMAFLVLIATIRAFSTPGEHVWSYGGWIVTREGIVDGLLFSWRVLLATMLGLLFIASTRSSEVRAGVAWILALIPGFPAARVSTMLSLLIRFIPLIANQAGRIMDAQRARCVELRKNPFYRLMVFIVVLIREVFKTGDRLAFAMEARCYRDDPTLPELSVSIRDYFSLLIACGLCAILLFC